MERWAGVQRGITEQESAREAEKFVYTPVDPTTPTTTSAADGGVRDGATDDCKKGRLQAITDPRMKKIKQITTVCLARR